VEALAVSDSSGTALLFSRGGNSQSSLVKSGVEFSEEDTSEQISVTLTTLDHYLSVNGIPEIRWLKIDAEGAEIRILKGAKEVLASRAEIICELHPYAWPEFGNTLQELKELAAESRRSIRYLDQTQEIGRSAVYGTVLLERQN
jgi:hypothetical protein